MFDQPTMDAVQNSYFKLIQQIVYMYSETLINTMEHEILYQ